MSFLLSALLHLLRPLVPESQRPYDALPPAADVVIAAARATPPSEKALSPNTILPHEEPPPLVDGPDVAFKLPPSQKLAAPIDSLLPPSQESHSSGSDDCTPVLAPSRSLFWERAVAVLRVAISQFDSLFAPPPVRQPTADYGFYSYGPWPQRVVQHPSLSDALVLGADVHDGPRGVVSTRRRQVSGEYMSRSRWERLTSRAGAKVRAVASRAGLPEVLSSPPGQRRATRARLHSASGASTAHGRSSEAFKENKAPTERVSARRVAAATAASARAAAAMASKAGLEGKGARVTSERGVGGGMSVKTKIGRSRESGPSHPSSRGVSAPSSRSAGRHAHFARSPSSRAGEVVEEEAQPRHTYTANVPPPPSIYHHLPRAPLGTRTGASGGSGWAGRRASRRQRRSMDMMVVSAAGSTCLDE
ncbi:hypothetical protein MMPV_000128 [Pyropia vietnamensis]